MEITSPQSRAGWISVISNGRAVSAKVYDEPSTFGVFNGRVSKISICKKDQFDDGNYFAQLDYNYDRGLDFDRLPEGLLKKIIADLESLPKQFD